MRIPLGIINLKPKSTRSVSVDIMSVPVSQPPVTQQPSAPVPQSTLVTAPVPQPVLTPISSTLGSKAKERLKDKMPEPTSLNLSDQPADIEKEDKTIDDKQSRDYVE